MRSLEQCEYFDALNRFTAEAGIKEDEKKEYCQYFTEGGCKATSLKNCEKCKFFCPTTPKKIEIVVGHAIKIEKLNDSLMEKNQEISDKNHALQSMISILEKKIEVISLRVKKLEDRIYILKYLKEEEFGKYFRLSLLRSKRIPQNKEKDRHLNKELMKEWDDVRLIINPNAKR